MSPSASPSSVSDVDSAEKGGDAKAIVLNMEGNNESDKDSAFWVGVGKKVSADCMYVCVCARARAYVSRGG